MRAAPLLLLATLAACGSSTDTAATRYNFAVIDGRGQTSTAGTATLAKPITSQLTRDPQGQFATRVFDLLAPAKAYAQGLTLAGDPVANAIVCGREAATGEPQVVPLCAFTLADGKAPNVVQPGTKAGTFNMVFTAQVPSQEPVIDSTTVTVEAGPMASTVFVHGTGFQCWTLFPALNVKDQYGNAVAYRFVTKGSFAHVASDVLGTEGARTLMADAATDPATPTEFQSVDVEVASGVIATGRLTVPSLAAGCVSLDF
jgi:hypothetical protein